MAISRYYYQFSGQRPLQSTNISRIKVLAAGVAVALIFTGCDKPQEPCPTKGWVSDKCVPIGDFRYGNNVLHIPNTEPNKYPWQGGLTYVPENRAQSDEAQRGRIRGPLLI